MKVQKYELARAIDRVKSVVTKNDQIPALAGVLVSKGYLIASNGELTVRVKLEGSEDESFIIPMKAFDLIKNLPDGEVDLSCDSKFTLTIKEERIKNSYRSFDPIKFKYYKEEEIGEHGPLLPGMRLMEALAHVIFAAADKDNNKTMTGVYFKGTADALNLAALDGHVVATDCIAASGTEGIELIVPKSACKKLLSMGMSDDVQVWFTNSSIVFKTDEYSISSRLIDGKYFNYERMMSVGNNHSVIDRKVLIDAVTRAKMCVDDKDPAVFELEDDSLKISVMHSTSDYSETVPLKTKIEAPLRIGFNSKLVLDTIRAFTCDNLRLNFTNAVTPMVIEADDSDMKALVLPVKLRGDV